MLSKDFQLPGKAHAFPRATESISLLDAWGAVGRLLQYYQRMDGIIDEILVEMQLDPAAWDLWLDCLDDNLPPNMEDK